MENDVVRELSSDPGVLQRALAYTTGALSVVSSAMLGMIWRQHNAEMGAIKKDIAELKQNCMPKAEFERHREEVRDDVQRVHERIDQLDTEAQNRHNDLMNTLVGMSIERRSHPRD